MAKEFHIEKYCIYILWVSRFTSMIIEDVFCLWYTIQPKSTNMYHLIESDV